MNIKTAIKKAKQQGWDESTSWFDGTIIAQKALLAPTFWKSLGKSQEWKRGTPKSWKKKWHTLINNLAQGQDLETAFDKATH